MCLIVEKRASDRLTKKQIKDYIDHNKDGYGFLWYDNGALKTSKGFGLDSCWKQLRKLKNKACYIHFRQRTSGDIDLEGCHPHKILPGIYLMHNGVLDIPVNGRSDTSHLCSDYLAPLLQGLNDPSAFIRSAPFEDILKAIVGKSQRIVIADKQGAVTYFNDLWHTMDNGMRVSNTYAWSSPKQAVKVWDSWYDYYDREYAASSYKEPTKDIKDDWNYWFYSKQEARDMVDTDPDTAVELLFDAYG